MTRISKYLLAALVALTLAGCDARDTREGSQHGTDVQPPAQAQPLATGDHSTGHSSSAAGNSGTTRPPGAQLTSDTGDCNRPQAPLGALPPAIPMWCEAAATGKPTFVSGANSWVDDFDHGLSNADLGPGYVVFDRHAGVNQIARSQHFRHNNHWMVDIDRTGTSGRGGSMMRPDRTFTAVGGEKITVETTFAAGVQEYGEEVWGEVFVTTGAQPSSEPASDELYGFGQFRGHWTAGCRLHSHRTMICALFNTKDPPGDHGSRLWEISFYVVAGTSGSGGAPGAPGSELNRAWRTCAGSDPDLNCRDTFRLELARSSRTLTVYVNGVKYFEQTGLPGLDQAAFWTEPFYAYNASWMSQPSASVVRYHWDRFAVNP